jgi:hypothetical protein
MLPHIVFCVDILSETAGRLVGLPVQFTFLLVEFTKFT